MNCSKLRAGRAARLFFVIQQISSLFTGVVVAVVFVPSVFSFRVARNHAGFNLPKQKVRLRLRTCVGGNIC